jgi:Leucine-rich repeat (LRR) protein
MPVRENVYYFNDEEAYNLRYCEDMVCVDIGHMSIHDIDFVRYMPNLQYLILAHTQVQYIEPISSCKKLKFLELDWSPIRDLTPLKECTALEDLNLGNTFADFAPIKKMTWLKNLWMIDCSTRARYEMTQALPDTRVMVTGAATVANGWRDLDNYYAMRDLLGMHYMSW